MNKEYSWLWRAVTFIIFNMARKESFPTLDLHGFKKDEVFDAVDRFIMKNQSAKQVRIMPGKGEGIVRSELLRYLKLGGYPWKYEELPNGSQNTGSVIVFL
jgi:DNA-nicking Smr family endonuclease